MTLPLLISSPHASDHVPPWILAEMLKTGEPEAALRRRILREGDPLTDAIYDLPGARARVSASASRFVADLNRERDEGGENGVIKLTDFERRPFYPTGFRISDADRERRLSQYYDPFHAALDRAARSAGPRFFIDGHSMTAQGPAIGPDSGIPRPALCIGNFGDAEGESAGTPTSCAPALARRIRDLCNDYFKDIFAAAGLSGGARLNQPFDGGHILRKYTSPPYALPGVMVEMNRALYLDEVSLEPIPGRVEALREALVRLAGSLFSGPHAL